VRLEGERKTDLGTKIIPCEHPQSDRQQAPVKRCTETVYVPRCWMNARGFKRLKDTFHLQRTSGFSKPALARTLSPVIEKIFSEKARCRCRSPCDFRDCGARNQKSTCLYVATSSHDSRNYHTSALPGKALYFSRGRFNGIVTQSGSCRDREYIPSEQTAFSAIVS
jgi:hypothetical protein